MKKMSVAKALNTALHQLMENDQNVIVLGEDIVGGNGLDTSRNQGGIFGVTLGLVEKFGSNRVMDTPISETAFLGAAIGASMTGSKPIVEIMFCDFLGVCFDQLMNQAAKVRFLSNDRIKMPLVIRTTMGAGDGSGAMHSQSLYAMVASIPGLKVVVPSNAADAAGLLKSAIKCDDPVVIFENKNLYFNRMDVDENLPEVPLGKGRVVRQGNSITLVALSAMLLEVIDAAKALAELGISVEVIDPRSVSPLDIPLISESVAKTGRLLVVDEGASHFGFASEVITQISQNNFTDLKQAPETLTPPHTPIPYAANLETEWLPNAKDIQNQVLKMVRVDKG